MRPFFLLVLSVCAASAGQVLFKKGVLAMGAVTLGGGGALRALARLALDPWVASGLVLYVVSTVLWLVALSRTTLNYAYPFTALTFALVMLSSRVVFQESIPHLRYWGIGLIVAGVVVSSLAKS